MADCRRDIKILCWNANGIKRDLYEYRELLYEEDVDIALLNETHLKTGDRLSARNYSVYRHDRITHRGGGSAILIKNSIQHYPLSLTSVSETEGMAININLSDRNKMTIGTIYNPPHISLDANVIDEIFQTNNTVIIAGDLNSKNQIWNCRQTNQNGRTLHNYCIANKVSVLAPAEPTYYPPRRNGLPDILDIGVLKNCNFQVDIEVMSIFDSDHNPIIITVSHRAFHNIPIYTRINWNIFRKTLAQEQEISFDYINSHQLDTLVKEFSEKIQTALEKAKSVQTKDKKQQGFPTWLRELIREKNRARKLWQQTRQPTDKTAYNRIKNLVTNNIRNIKNEEWYSLLQNLNIQDNSLWEFLKRIKKKKIKYPPIRGASGLVYDDVDKAEVFADTLKEQFQPNDEPKDQMVIDDIENNMTILFRANIINCNRTGIVPTTVTEIANISKELNAKKSPGEDKIPNAAIKKLPVAMVKNLTKIINELLKQKHFPDIWKTANVCVFPKVNESPTFPQNYRPISLLPHLGKVYEKVIARNINQYLDTNNLIPEEQFGFRKGHSTTLQLLRVVEHIQTERGSKKQVLALFVDVAKAFDRVWHDGLIQKMINAEIPLDLIQLTRSYLQDRHFRVKINSAYSGAKDIHAGVPQGSVLGPILFNIFMSDIPTTDDHFTALYADDMTVIVSDRNRNTAIEKLQDVTDKLARWCTFWRVKINTRKCAVIHFAKARTPLEKQIMLFNQPIQYCRSIKYLGVILDQKLNFSEHTTHVIKKGNAAIAAMQHLIHGRSKTSNENKILLYNQVVIPIILYASPVWNFTLSSNLHRLQVFQNKAIRKTIGIPWFVRNEQIHRDLELPTVKQRIDKIARSFFRSVEVSEFEYIRKLVEYDGNRKYYPKRPKQVFQLLD